METFKYTTHSRTILADLYTPVGVYMRLRDLYPQSALMVTRRTTPARLSASIPLPLSLSDTVRLPSVSRTVARNIMP